MGNQFAKKIKKGILLLFCLFFIQSLLLHSKDCFLLATNGLELWFSRMLPTLFPFMIISSILVTYQLIPLFVLGIKPFLYPFFKLPDAGYYCIVIGFLCGFPMGAKNIAQVYQKGQLTKAQAEALLGFCNNIGPVYFLSFAIPLLKQNLPELSVAGCLFGMYGIPLLYGIFRCRLVNSENTTGMLSYPRSTSCVLPFDSIITNNLESIVKLGGYMMFFHVLMIFFRFLPDDSIVYACCYCFTEITGGITRLSQVVSVVPNTIKGLLSLLYFFFLQLGGLCCIFQTKSMLSQTDLSLKKYVYDKLILSLLTIGYHAVCVFF